MIKCLWVHVSGLDIKSVLYRQTDIHSHVLFLSPPLPHSLSPIYHFFLLLWRNSTCAGLPRTPSQTLSPVTEWWLCLQRCCMAWLSRNLIKVLCKAEPTDHMVASIEKVGCKQLGALPSLGQPLRWYPGVFLFSLCRKEDSNVKA